MAARVSRTAPPGSLLKKPREATGKHRGRPKRELAPDHLALIRRCPCLSCDADPAGVAAHLRMGVRGGTGLKPDDRWAVPLCQTCHEEQHAVGELVFWLRLKLDPIRIAMRLHAVSPSLGAMRNIVFKQREVRK